MNKGQSDVTLIGPLGIDSFILPMVGTRVCAGFPSPADDFLDEEIDLVAILTPNAAATFLRRFAGNSMLDAGIHDGDVIVVDRSVKPKHGRVVVCAINGETSLKLYQTKPVLRLAVRIAAVIGRRIGPKEYLESRDITPTLKIENGRFVKLRR